MIQYFKFIIVSFVCTFLILLVGCKPVKTKEVYGTYVAKYPFGTEELILSTNGEYKQDINIVVDNNVTDIKNVGLWKYQPKTGNVTFENFLIITSGSELRKKFEKGISVMPVEKFFPWSSITIEINPDCGYSYIKQDN